ncbi:MAG: PqqD family protein [Chloroflexi bacterium]|nr:PqqD family protein [Chloroflexota bacterium]
MNATTQLRRSPDASYQDIAGEAILIHLKTGVYYSLNEIGTFFWNQLDGERTIAGYAQLIAGESVDAPPIETITADLIELAEKLAKENLVIAR